jgi:hypothetical protein
MLRTRAAIKSMGKAHRCSKCNRLRKGHEGPCGLRCSMTADEEWDSASEITDSNDNVTDMGQGPTTRSKSNAIEAGRSEANEAFMMEIARQLGELTVNVASLMAEKTLSKAQCVSSSSAGVDGAPSSSSSRTVTSPARPAVTPTAPVDVEQVALTNGSRVTKKLVKNAKAGEFVDLNELVPSNEPSNVMESRIDEESGNLIFKKKSIKKTAVIAQDG